MKRVYILFLLILLQTIAFGQIENRFIRRGNRDYDKKKYSQAEAQYRIALNKNPKSYPADFNLGLALYKQNNKLQAIRSLSRVAGLDTSATLNAKSLYNYGVVNTRIAQDSLKQRNLQGAIKYLQNAVSAFKLSVANNPNNYQARYNLWLTQKILEKLKQQQKQQQKNNKNNKNKNKNNKQKQNKNNKNGNKNKQKQNNKQNKNKNKQQQNKNNNQNQKNNQQKNKQNSGFNPQEINRLLQAVQQADKKAQAKALKKMMNIKTNDRKMKPW